MAKEKFNLTSLLNKRSVEMKSEDESEENKQEFEIKLIDVFNLEESKENFYDINEIEEMKQSIELLGIEQNLIVKELSNGRYKVLAGHRRRLASIKLVEEGKEKFRFVPCRIKNTTNEILDRLTIIMTNSTQRELSDWEKVRQALEVEKLVLELKREVGIQGRTRDLLSEITNTSPSQLGRYKAISNNLSQELMIAFKSCQIGFSVAYEASGLSEVSQKKIFRLLNENQEVTLADVKTIKKEEEENKQIPGQIELFEVNSEDEILTEEDNLDNSNVADEEKTIIENTDKEIRKDEVKKEDTEEVEKLEEHEKDEYKIEENLTEQQESNVDTKGNEDNKIGCNFCRKGDSLGISSKNETYSMYIERVKRRLTILSNSTGEVDEFVFIYCPICGERL